MKFLRMILVKLNSVHIKETIFILFLSATFSISYNFFSENGIPLIRTPRELEWESDSTINMILQSMRNNLKEGNNLIKNSVMKTLNNKTKKIDSSKGTESLITILDEKKRSVESKNKQPDTINNIQRNDTISKTNNAKPKIIKPVAITVEQAIKIFGSDNSIFIDARTEGEYKLGHIKGAISIPLKKFDQYNYKLNVISKNSIIVTYCDGRGCDLSIDLAEKIVESGFLNVKIFYGGWIDWKEKNYPIE
jgi:rhodanese-related sulfurtransferase